METLQLLLKYHGRAARYAYYPPLGEWKQQGLAFDLAKALENRDGAHEKGIDLYIHIPYCRKLCTFCGCNIKVTANQEEETPYIDQLINEWAFKKKYFSPLKLASLTLGGGSPNFLSPSALTRLLDCLFQGTARTSTFRFVLEADPRHLQPSWLKSLKDFSPHLFSLGVQDFNERVLANVNRHQQGEEDILQACEFIRQVFPTTEIGLDFIYGLPHQNPRHIEKWRAPLQKITPEQVAFYPLAPVPWQINAQKALGDFTLPPLEEKYQLLLAGHQLFRELGFLHLGFGYYARKESTLGLSLQRGHLERQVMGYAPHRGGLLLGLGVSALSVAGRFRWQNERALGKYLHSPVGEIVERFHHQSEEEEKLERGLEEITCRGTLPAGTPLSLKQQYRLEKILPPEGDILTERGKLLLKSICQNYLDHF